MIAFMREEKRRSPEAFRTKYVLRDARHPQCLPYFFALADGYRRLKVLIDVPEIEEFNRYASNPALLPDYRPPEYVHLQFLSRRRFVPWKTKVIASQQIRVTEMDHISGTTAEFTLSTSRYVYCFMPEGVEIERRDAVSLGGE